MMVQPVETEIKLAATPAMLKKLRTHPRLAGADQTATLITTYYDTTDGKLRDAGASLRLRDSGQEREQTLKFAAVDGSSVRRNEWNVATRGDLPDIQAFPARARSALARLLDDTPLEAVASTRVERTTRRIHHGGSVIEIAFDLGTVNAGKRKENLCELEMELIEGRLSDVLSLALELPLGPALGWSVVSKAERCHALAFDLPPTPAHAQPVVLSPDWDVARGFQAIAWNCLQQLLRNYPLVIATGDPESVHQARVAIRRLRAACSLFGDVADDPASLALRGSLKAVAAGLGPARDLHVLHDRVTSAASGDDDVAELTALLGGQRDGAVHSAQALLAAAPFQRLLFEFAAWLEGGEWLKRKAETGGDQPLAPFAARTLSRRRRKLRRAREGLGRMSDDTRHQLRIAVKKLRYAAGFFASLFDDEATAKARKAFAKDLSRLQDSLGELNDLAVAADGQDALFAGLEPGAAARTSAQLEELLDAAGKSRRKLLKVAERSLEQVADAKAWWKTGWK